MDLELRSPSISMGHLLPHTPGRGSWKLSSKHVGRRVQFFSALGPVKTKRKVAVTSFTGTMNSNPVSCCLSLAILEPGPLLLSLLIPPARLVPTRPGADSQACPSTQICNGSWLCPSVPSCRTFVLSATLHPIV